MGRKKVLFVTLVAIVGLVVPLAPAGAQAGSAGIHGTVTGADTDARVAEICVTVHDEDVRREVVGSDTTDGSGNYDIDGLDPGDYKVYFHDCAGATRDQDERYAYEWHLDEAQYETARVVTLSGGQDADIDAELQRGGDIAGTVTGADTDSGVAGICVLVVDPLDYGFAAQVETRSNGRFTAGGLRSQDYWVKFSDCSDDRTPANKYAFEWYDDQITIDDAARVPVAGTATTGAVDAELARAGRIGGTVTGPTGPLANACVDVVHERYHSVAGATTGSDGTYRVLGLPPGDYTVAFYDCDGNSTQLGFEWWQEAGSVDDATAVAVSAGGGSTGINGTLTAGGSITGTVTADGGDDGVANVCAVAHDPSVHDRPVLGGRTGSNGSFTIDHLRAGKSYKVEYFDCRRTDRRYRLEYLEGDADGDGESLLFPSGDAVAVTAGQTSSASESLGDIVSRIFGRERIETSTELSGAAFEPGETDTVVIARQDKYPDALAGAPLAHALDAPILLSNSDHLTDRTRAEIQRLDPSRAVLLGGTSALSQRVEDEVNDIVPDVDRVWGPARWDTAKAISEQSELDGADRAYVVEGAHELETRGWPDAVSVGALASHLGRPILLTLQGDLPDATGDALRAFEDATIIGGNQAVSDDVQQQIDGIVDTVDRIFGTTRFETSVAVARVSEDARDPEAGNELSPNRMWLATGSDWPDALTAGPTVARDLGVLLIVPREGLEPATSGFLQTFSDEIHRVLMLGGVVALEPQVESDARAAIDAGAAVSAQSAGSDSGSAALLLPGSDAWRTVVLGG